jgi:hypothetical protein
LGAASAVAGRVKRRAAKAAKIVEVVSFMVTEVTDG